jgi:hypothetical protein
MPFGDQVEVRALSDNETKELWESIRNSNIAQNVPCTQPMVFIVKKEVVN